MKAVEFATSALCGCTRLASSACLQLPKVSHSLDAHPKNREDLAARLRRWLQFHFQEFLPHVAGVFDWKAQGARVVRAQEVVGCLDCRSPLWFRPGEMGVLADEAFFHP